MGKSLENLRGASLVLLSSVLGFPLVTGKFTWLNGKEGVVSWRLDRFLWTKG